MKNQTPIINIFEKAVRKAGKGLIRDFGESENLQIQNIVFVFLMVQLQCPQF